jgi:hypothetical protein
LLKGKGFKALGVECCPSLIGVVQKPPPFNTLGTLQDFVLLDGSVPSLFSLI